MILALRTYSTIAAMLVLCACDATPDNSAKIASRHALGGTQPGSGVRALTSHAAVDSDAVGKKLLDAAEPFETLTETVFSADRDTRNAAIEAAQV